VKRVLLNARNLIAYAKLAVDFDAMNETITKPIEFSWRSPPIYQQFSAPADVGNLRRKSADPSLLLDCIAPDAIIAMPLPKELVSSADMPEAKVFSEV